MITDMKKLAGILLVLGISASALIAVFHYPYLYVPLPRYWSVSKLGFPEIKQADDFRHYYLDVLDAKGYNKKEIRYSAIHQAYRNSDRGSYVNVRALIELAGSPDNIDDKLTMQNSVLEKHIGFNNRCYNNQCASGHHIAGLALEYARNLAARGDLDSAYNILTKTYSARKSDLRPWVKFSLLEQVYFILVKKDLKKPELDFFSAAIAAINTGGFDARLDGRYRKLLDWNVKLHAEYSQQASSSQQAHPTVNH